MMKIFKKVFRSCFIVLSLSLVVIISFIAYHSYLEHKSGKINVYSRPALIKAADGNSISPSYNSLYAYKKRLSERYPNIYQAAFDAPSQSHIGSNVTIPGLVVTRAYDYTKRKITEADEMTPQGITIADKYILVSAYDAKNRHASVIYVINSHTQKYVKTIQVPGRPHLGGITYDPVAHNIWITGRQNGQAALMSFSLKKLKRYDYKKKHKSVQYDHIVTLPTVERASCVTYYDNQLFICLFNKYCKGQIVSYPISRTKPYKGTIISDQIKAVTGEVSWALGSGSAGLDPQIQGLAFYQNRIILSQSYGSQDSKLYFYSTSALNNLDNSKADKVVNLPPYLEQIHAVDGQLLMLFESGSKAYARDNMMVMDRILSVNINALLGS